MNLSKSTRWILCCSIGVLVFSSVPRSAQGQGLGPAWASVGFTLYRPDGKAYLQVAKEDLPEKMLWENATTSCAALGGGWRLPSRNELDMMYRQLHKEGKGNFKPYWYWSRTQYVMHMHFGSGFVSNDFYSQFNEFNVRAVRNMP
jgi:hypothetical protein